VRLGRPPAGERERRAWLQEVRVIAADRDRYQITDPNPLGGEPSPGGDSPRATDRQRQPCTTPTEQNTQHADLAIPLNGAASCGGRADVYW
jgi:hypothetical protein